MTENNLGISIPESRKKSGEVNAAYYMSEVIQVASYEKRHYKSMDYLLVITIKI